MTESEKHKVIEALKQLEGIKRGLHALLKGDANDAKNNEQAANA